MKKENPRVVSEKHDGQWDQIIKPEVSLLSIDFREIWRYRTLLQMYVKRDIVTFYKQTILGPLWFFIQPLFTTLIFNSENYHQKPGARSYFFKMTGIFPLLSATLVAAKHIKDVACRTMKICC